MSRRNYNKMYEKPAVEDKVDPTPIEEVTEPVAETVVEPEVQTAIEGVAAPAVVEVKTIEPKTPKTLSAVVVGCSKLNVREEPASTANVVAVIDASSEVVVYENKSTGNYYNVCTASGIEGYCVKDYLKLK